MAFPKEILVQHSVYKQAFVVLDRLEDADPDIELVARYRLIGTGKVHKYADYVESDREEFNDFEGHESHG